jgi:hypothetical protein
MIPFFALDARRRVSFTRFSDPRKKGTDMNPRNLAGLRQTGLDMQRPGEKE